MNTNNLKNSTYNTKNGRYVIGGTTEVSSIAIEHWDKNVMQSHPTDIVYYVESQYVNKPHMLGYVFYGDTGLWWVICQYNGILDPITEIIEGKLLMIPLKERISSLGNSIPKIGGIPSTRIIGL